MSEVTATHLVKVFEDFVLVRSPDGEYKDTAENYAADAGRSFPPLPTPKAGARPYVGRVYIPGEKHSLLLRGKAEPQRLPWDPGDEILTTVAALLAAQDARRQTEQDATPPDVRQLFVRALEALLEERGGQPNPPEAITEYLHERDAQDAARGR